jgi:hypothetical protein
LLLFLWILGRSSWFAWRGARAAEPDDTMRQTKTIIAALMCALVVNSMFGLTFTLYSIAPLVWLFIGWISVETLRAREHTERETIII